MLKKQFYENDEKYFLIMIQIHSYDINIFFKQYAVLYFPVYLEQNNTNQFLKTTWSRMSQIFRSIAAQKRLSCKIICSTFTLILALNGYIYFELFMSFRHH